MRIPTRARVFVVCVVNLHALIACFNVSVLSTFANTVVAAGATTSNAFYNEDVCINKSASLLLLTLVVGGFPSLTHYHNVVCTTNAFAHLSPRTDLRLNFHRSETR